MSMRNISVTYLASTRIGEKGQVTVPKQFRDDLGVRTGAPFAVLRIGNGLILIPEQQRFEQLCAEVNASLVAAEVNARDLVATLPEARRRVYERRYGKLGKSLPRRKSSRNASK